MAWAGRSSAGRTGRQTAISAEFLKKDFDRGLALVADAVLHPTFPGGRGPENTGARSRQRQGRQGQSGRGDQSVLRKLLLRRGAPVRARRGRGVDRPHPPRRHSRVSQAHVRGPQPGRDRRGRFRPGELRSGGSRRRSAGRRPERLTNGRRTSRRPPASRVLLIDKPDATQTYFVIAQPGVRRSTPDRTALHAGEHVVRRTVHLDDQRGAAHQYRTDVRRALAASDFAAHRRALTSAPIRRRRPRSARSTSRWRC